MPEYRAVIHMTGHNNCMVQKVVDVKSVVKGKDVHVEMKLVGECIMHVRCIGSSVCRLWQKTSGRFLYSQTCI